MAKLLMITGDRALAEGKHGAFYNTIEEFHKHWERIDIICPRVNSSQFIAHGSNNSELRTTNPFNNVFVHSSPWPLILQPLWILKEGLRILRTNNYEPKSMNYLMTVHEYPPFYNGIGARLLWSRLSKEKSRILDSRSESGQKTGVPYVLEIFHIPGHPRASTVKEEIYKNLMKIFVAWDASKAKAIRTMNKQVGLFLKESGISPEKITLIPAVYVDLDIFKPADVSKKYDLIFIGRLEENKGINLLLEAVKFMVHGSLSSVKCLIVGEGSLKKELEQRTINYELNNNVFFHGWAKDSAEIAGLLNESKILVMPSYNEGGPRVVVEAMACGVPVLATPVGIVPDLLKNGSGGEIIDWEGEDIAVKTRGILSDSEGYNKLRDMAIETAKSFEKKAAIKNYADKLKQIIVQGS